MSRILFVMQYPGYLRLYATTVLALAERGHEVLLAYDKMKHTSGEKLIPDDAPASVRVIGNVPSHGGPWRDLLVELGCTIDYIRFLSSDGGTPYLRMRMDRYLPSRFARLRRVGAWPAPFVRGLVAAARIAERAIPVDLALVEYLRELAPSAIVITPLVLRGPGGVQQTQLVKAARHTRIPIALAVGSWDHLSSKGFVRVQPDMVIVWNEIQRREAVRMHRVPEDRIVITGAQPFDVWFSRDASLSRDAFLTRVSLPIDRPMLLYVGSSRGITRPELELPFVHRWLQALRGSGDPALRTASVLLRPHHSNMDAWQEAQFSEFGAVSIWPRQRPTFPMTEIEADDYFHSMYYSSAVLGINTSAMIEASIVGRQVYTIQAPEFRPTQDGTTHFRYLVHEGGGCVESASTLDDHLAQLSRGLADSQYGAETRIQFVERFVRPKGLDQPAVNHVAAAIERLAHFPTASQATARSSPTRVQTSPSKVRPS